MKILFVTNEVPYPPDNGIRIVSYHAMRLMYEAGHQIALAVLTDENDDVETRFQRICTLFVSGPHMIHQLPGRSRLHIMANSLVRGVPYFVERYRNKNFEEKLKLIIDGFQPQAVHLDSICLSQYVTSVDAGIGTVASINDSYAFTLKNSISAKVYGNLECLYRRLQYFQTATYEKTTYEKFNTTHVMSDYDSSYLRGINPRIHTTVISNGVDPSLLNETTEPVDSNDIIFVAKLVGENLENLKNFLDQSWPIVMAIHPSIKIHIVGKIGNEAALFRKAYECDNVVFEGYLDNLASIYQKCGIAIVPINKNCGIINKAIEAMAAGLAVVGFQKSFAGIPEAVEGIHFLAAENYADFGEKLSNLVANQPLKASLQLSARTMARQCYSWQSRKQKYENMYLHAYKQANSISNDAGATRANQSAGLP